jgi:hypothetical protein
MGMTGGDMKDLLKRWFEKFIQDDAVYPRGLKVGAALFLIASSITNFKGANALFNNHLLAAVNAAAICITIYTIGHSIGLAKTLTRIFVFLLAWAIISPFSMFMTMGGVFEIRQSSIRADENSKNLAFLWNSENNKINGVVTEIRGWGKMKRIRPEYWQKTEDALSRIRISSGKVPQTEEQAYRELDEAFSNLYIAYSTMGPQFKAAHPFPQRAMAKPAENSIYSMVMDQASAKTGLAKVAFLIALLQDFGPVALFLCYRQWKSIEEHVWNFRKKRQYIKVARTRSVADCIPDFVKKPKRLAVQKSPRLPDDKRLYFAVISNSRKNVEKFVNQRNKADKQHNPDGETIQ